jgi:FAD/FMN-containing dehydrogenase
VIVEHLSKSTAPMRVAQLRPLGGALARVPNEATAFAYRSEQVIVNVAAFYDGARDRPAKLAWVHEFARALHADATRAYVNFVLDEGPARVLAAYPQATWDRLRRIKAAYDPTNLFRLNHNVPPAES